MANYIGLLQKELIPAFGCTEPIALAFTAAKAVEVLGYFPQKMLVKCSGNMIKNAKSVSIPNSDGKVGIEYSCILGALVGNTERALEVLQALTPKMVKEAEQHYKDGMCTVLHVPDVENLYIEILAYGDNEEVSVIVQEEHTNVVFINKNGNVIYENKVIKEMVSKEDFTFDSIYAFANEADISALTELLDKQIAYNMAIAKEGLTGSYGTNIGKLLLEIEQGVSVRAKAMAAAGSDARMNGCNMPVIINCGSGNQGITISVPIAVFAEEKNISKDRLHRALCLANLLALYIKQGIGRLSAYCGVISAAAASVAGIAYLLGEEKDIVAETLVNALAGASGVICDGAKSSCAHKIALGLSSGFLGYQQAKTGNSFRAGEGIVKESIDRFVEIIGDIGRDGMKETDNVVLKKMLEK